MGSAARVTRPVFLFVLVLLLVGVNASAASAAAPPVAAYSFEEGAGSSDYDVAGTHKGEIKGAKWTSSGKYGSALESPPPRSLHRWTGVPEHIQEDSLRTEIRPAFCTMSVDTNLVQRQCPAYRERIGTISAQ
jgi:hypothetical protein